MGTEYYILILQGGRNIREHDFIRNPTGGYLFTEEETFKQFERLDLMGMLPIVIPKNSLDNFVENNFKTNTK